jgi:DNA-directed RNA polymerase subunit RPC12/RpoP
MPEYVLRCATCGKAYDAQVSDVQQLHAAKEKLVYICQPCQAKIKYESEQKHK